MEFENTTRTLRDLVHKFHNGAILLPQFQRNYVWKSAKIRNLLDSLLRGFPIGAFYLWRPTQGDKDPRGKGFGPTRISQVFDGYLVDGQQRLTSLEAAFGLYEGEDKGGHALRCFLDLSAPDREKRRDTRLFATYASNKRVADRVENGDLTLVDLASLKDGNNPDLRDSIRAHIDTLPWSPEQTQSAMRRLDASFGMLDQQVPCTTIYNASDEDAVEVFGRLNKGGSPLRQGDVRAAELARGKAVGVLKRMRDFVGDERLSRLGFGFSFAFRALVLFHRDSAQFAALKSDWMEAPGPDDRTLLQSWKRAESAISSAAKFVDTRLGWSRRELLPSANTLIVLASAIDRLGKRVSQGDEEVFRRFLCLTALRGVFQGSVESVINRFHRSLRENSEGPAEGLLQGMRVNERRKITADEFNRYAQLWGPTTQVMHAWLVGVDARDWLSGSPLKSLTGIKGNTHSGGDLTVHHIFPRKVLKEASSDFPNYANVPANYALLSRTANSEFGAKPPDVVLTSLKPQERERAQVQFFESGDSNLLDPSLYEDFCEWRAKKLAHAMNDWLGLE